MQMKQCCQRGLAVHVQALPTNTPIWGQRDCAEMLILVNVAKILLLAKLAVKLLLQVTCYSRTGSRRGKHQRGQPGKGLEAYMLIRMARQHHQENASQIFQQCPSSSDETQCPAPEPQHNSGPALQFSSRDHTQQHQ